LSRNSACCIESCIHKQENNKFFGFASKQTSKQAKANQSNFAMIGGMKLIFFLQFSFSAKVYLKLLLLREEGRRSFVRSFAFCFCGSKQARHGIQVYYMFALENRNMNIILAISVASNIRIGFFIHSYREGGRVSE